MFCARCGNQVPDGDRVCTQCGANLLELFAVRSTPPTSDGASAPTPPRLSDSQVWDRFMRPAAGRSPASTGADADPDADVDTGTQPLPSLDDVTRPLPGMSAQDGATGNLPPLDRTRVMDPLGMPPDADAGSGVPASPVAAASPPVTAGPVSSVADAGVGDLPPEWFRGATAVDPGAARARPDASGGVQRPNAPLGSMIEPAPGRPPAPGQRRRHERLSAAGVAALVCVPIALVAVFVGRYLSQHHGAQGVQAVATTPAGTPTAATGTPAASASATTPTGVPANATSCGAAVWAGAGTSCEFARVVAAAATANTAENFQISATSPVTGIRYTMNCSRTAGLDTCTGGRAAAVYVRVG